MSPTAELARCIFLVTALSAGRALADITPACTLSVAETAIVDNVDDEGTLALRDHRKLRLANLHLTGDAAAKFMRSHYLGKTLSLAYDQRATDRYGRLVAQLYAPRWLQAELVTLGLARVTSTPTIRRCARTLLALEDKARSLHTGIWADASNRPGSAIGSVGDSGSFQIVEGRVISVKTLRDRVWLNFGPDYKTDFTVTVSKRDLRLFASDGIDPALWQGKDIRVRGWLTTLNGPEMEVTHPEQVELLGPAGK